MPHGKERREWRKWDMRTGSVSAPSPPHPPPNVMRENGISRARRGQCFYKHDVYSQHHSVLHGTCARTHTHTHTHLQFVSRYVFSLYDCFISAPELNASQGPGAVTQTWMDGWKKWVNEWMNFFLVNLLRTRSGSNVLYYSVFLGISEKYVKQLLLSDLPDSVIWEQRVILHGFKSFISIPFWFTSENQNSIYGKMTCPKAESDWIAHSSILTYLGSLFFFSTERGLWFHLVSCTFQFMKRVQQGPDYWVCQIQPRSGVMYYDLRYTAWQFLECRCLLDPTQSVVIFQLSLSPGTAENKSAKEFLWVNSWSSTQLSNSERWEAKKKKLNKVSLKTFQIT